jgi:hypothetical protein
MSSIVKTRIDVRLFGGLQPVYYKGTVNRDGAPHGYGSYEVAEGRFKGSTYSGHFLDGKRDGLGKYTWSDGSYVGEWKADEHHGFGKVWTVCDCL